MGSRTVGPLDQNSNPVTIDDGTHVLTRSQPAGGICATRDPNLLDRANHIRLALDMAQSKAGKAIARHTGDEFKVLVASLIPGLLLALAGLLATTAIGGAIGAFFGGVGAAPGAAIGLEVGLLLLNYLGLGFLAYYVVERIDQVMDAFGRGIQIAWNSCGDRDSLEAASTEFAEGVGIFFRLVLQALVLYLLKAAGEGKFSNAVNKLSESKLFRAVPQLREWLVANYQRLAVRFGMTSKVESVVEFMPPNTQTYAYDMINNPGPLARMESLETMRGSAAQTFIGGKYNEAILTQPTIFYRAQPGRATVVSPEGTSQLPIRIGSFFSPKPPPSSAIARIDTALKHFWTAVDGSYIGSSSAEVVLAVKIPAGTKVYYGPISSQGGVYVGGMENIQVFIKDVSKLPGVEIITETQLEAARTQGVIEVLQQHIK